MGLDTVKPHWRRIGSGCPTAEILISCRGGKRRRSWLRLRAPALSAWSQTRKGLPRGGSARPRWVHQPWTWRFTVSGGAMRAMVYRGPYKIRVEEKDIPALEHPNDEIVRVTLGAICGSDLHLYHGMMPDTRVGMTFGHEFIGVVHEVGPSVQNLRPGDRVMVPANIYCGSCFFCVRGLYANCHNVNPNATAVGGIYGYSHTCGGYDGGQAEYVRVPFADVGPSLIPEWMDDEDAVLLTDALATGYFGAQLGDIAEGDVVAVFGAGPVGLFAAKSAWFMGAGRVIVIDHLDYRLEKARSFAHAETYNFTEYDDIVVHMKQITG